MARIGTDERDGRTRHSQKLAGGASWFTAHARSVVHALREPVLLVLVLAGIVDALSGSPWSHGAMLVAVALALGGDAIRHRRAERAGAAEAVGASDHAGPQAAALEVAPPARTAPIIRLTPAVVIGGVLFAAVAGTFARFSLPSTVAVAVPGVAAITIAWRTPSRPRHGPEPAEPGAAAWATLFIVFGLWELANLLMQPSLTTGSYAHPTMSVLTDPVLASHLGRSVFLSLWLGFGLFLLER